MKIIPKLLFSIMLLSIFGCGTLYNPKVIYKDRIIKNKETTSLKNKIQLRNCISFFIDKDVNPELAYKICNDIYTPAWRK